ncbi:MAG: YdcF family protein [Parasporobacterium sp.]|nr:YdcF family protein [Parasporobacterium sp.]
MEERKKLKIIPGKQIIILFLAGTLAVYNTATLIEPGMNPTEYLVLFINICLLLYGIFFDWCQKIFAHGILRAVRIIWRCLFVLIAAMGIFMAVVYTGNNPDGDEKAIIVLGAPVSENNISRILTDRVSVAFLLANGMPDVPVILSGGGENAKVVSEAGFLAVVMEFCGIDPDRLILEDKSMTTAENFINTAKILQDNGYSLDDSYVVVSSTFHCYRAKEYAKAAGMDNIHFVGVMPELQDIPSWYLREIIAIINYWFTGK